LFPLHISKSAWMWALLF